MAKEFAFYRVETVASEVNNTPENHGLFETRSEAERKLMDINRYRSAFGRVVPVTFKCSEHSDD